MKFTEAQLRRLIREVMEAEALGSTWSGDEDPRSTPPEPNFVNGPDTYAGYIRVSDATSGRYLAAAPIYMTDGPDRPYLVRTTDTHWYVPHEEVRVMYPEIEDVFNTIDSKFDWRTLGPGSTGEMGPLTWEWIEGAGASPRVGRALTSASKSYIEEKEVPKKRFQTELTLIVKEYAEDLTKVLPRPGSPAHEKMIEDALDNAGIKDKSLRDLVSGPFMMIPPAFLLKL